MENREKTTQCDRLRFWTWQWRTQYLSKRRIAFNFESYSLEFAAFIVARYDISREYDHEDETWLRCVSVLPVTIISRPITIHGHTSSSASIFISSFTTFIFAFTS
jgi:hypothetical protein